MDLTYNLLPAQKEFIHVDEDVTLDVCIYQGGFGSGKTWIGSLLGILLCQKYPGILGMCVAKTYPMVKDTTLRTYKEHLHAFGLISGRDYTIKSENANGSVVFHCFGGSEILFRHLEDPDKIKSLNLGFVEIEEASMLSEADFLMILSRLRQAGIPRYRVFGHTNPQATKGWIWRYLVENNKGKHKVQEPDGRSSVISYRRIIAPTADNIYLSAAYVENMKEQYDEDYYKINVLGQDGDYTAGLVCKTWSEANIQDTPYRPELRLYLSCDFNVDPMSWVLAHRFNGEYHFIDEICLPNTTTVEATEEFARRYGTHTAGITVTGDASGDNRSTQSAKIGETNYTIIRNRLSQLGVRNVSLDVRLANPPILDRVAAWNAFVCNSSGVRRIRIDPKCEHLISNCENLYYITGTSIIWEPTQNDIKRDNKLKFVKHIFDAASYLVERYDSIRLEVPRDNRNKLKVIAARSRA